MSQVVTACLSLCRPKFNPRSVLGICGTSIFPCQQHFTNAPYSYFIFYQLYITLEINTSFIDSFIPLACAECDVSLLFSGASSIPLCYILFPATLFHQLFFHPPSLQLAIYFLVHLSVLLFPNSYTILFWEFYFLPFSVHAQTNVIY